MCERYIGGAVTLYSLGSNSVVRGKSAAAFGWSPTRRSITGWVADELDR